jgi:hypothetical protein
VRSRIDANSEGLKSDNCAMQILSPSGHRTTTSDHAILRSITIIFSGDSPTPRNAAECSPAVEPDIPISCSWPPAPRLHGKETPGPFECRAVPPGKIGQLRRTATRPLRQRMICSSGWAAELAAWPAGRRPSRQTTQQAGGPADTTQQTGGPADRRPSRQTASAIGPTGGPGHRFRTGRRDAGRRERRGVARLNPG